MKFTLSRSNIRQLFKSMFPNITINHKRHGDIIIPNDRFIDLITIRDQFPFYYSTKDILYIITNKINQFRVLQRYHFLKFDIVESSIISLPPPIIKDYISEQQLKEYLGITFPLITLNTRINAIDNDWNSVRTTGTIMKRNIFGRKRPITIDIMCNLYCDDN